MSHIAALPLAAVVLVAGWATQVRATPPDVISLRDMPFGLSPDRLFLMRTTFDNLGLYVTGRNDVLLVAVEIATGAEEIWPVFAVTRSLDATGQSETTKVDRGPDAVDPYAVLASFDGVPWTAVAVTPDAVDLQFGPETLSARYEDGKRFGVDTGAVLNAMTASVDRVAGAMVAYDRFAPIDTADLLRGRSFDPAFCVPSDPILVRTTIWGGLLQLTRLTCTADGIEATSLLVILPQIDD